MPAAELLFPSPPPTVVVAAATDDTENSTTRAAVTAANAVKEQGNAAGLHYQQKQQKQHQQQQQQKQERKNHVEVCVRIRPLVVQKGIRSNSFFARKEPVVNKKNGSSSSSSSIAHKGTTRENRNNSRKTSLLTPPLSSRLRKPQIPRQSSALPHKSTDKQAQAKDKISSSSNNNNNKTHTTTDDDNVIPTQSCAWDVVTNDTVRQNEHVTEIVQGRTCQYTFDQVYGPACTTQDIFQNSSIHELVQAAMQGYHTAVLAYGQTSTGKTHTMTGTVQQPGLIPLSIQACFDYINKKQHEEEEENREYLLRVSYLEVYNEHIRDLLLPPHTKTIVPIRLFESPSSSSEAGGVGGAGGGAGLVIKGLTEQVVTSPAQVFQLLQQGEARRQVGATSLNQHSSRSHVMVRIWIESRATVVGSQHTTNSAITSGGSNSGTVSSTSSVSSSTTTTTTFPTGAVRVSSLSLVDLAGSESVRLTGGNSDRRSEGHYINKSLMTLGQVVYALSEDDNNVNNNSNGNDVGGIAAGNSGIKKHIPYRDSKLTRLLQPCLSGNAQVCVLCCISPLPGHLEESHNTLKFATRAKKIPQRATIQETIIGGDEEKTLLQSYRQEIEDLRRQLKEAQEVQQRLLLKQQQQQQQSEVGSMTTTASTTPSLSRTSTGLSTSSFDFDNEVSESEIHELVNAIATMEKLILKSSSPSIAAAAAAGNKDVMPIKPEDLLDFSDNFLEEDDDDRKDEQDLLALVSGGSNSSAVPTATPSASKTLVRQVTSEPATPSNDDDDEDGNNNNANTSELHGELSRIKGLLGSVLQKRFRGSINNNSNNNNTNNEPPDDDIVRNLRAQLEEQQVTSSLRQADASFLQAQLTEKDNLLQEVSKLLEAVEERQTALEQENKALREQVARLKQKQQREQQQQSQQEDNDEEESLYSL